MFIRQSLSFCGVAIAVVSLAGSAWGAGPVAGASNARRDEAVAWQKFQPVPFSGASQTAGGIPWHTLIQPDAADYMYLEFTDVKANALGKFTLDIRTADGNVISEFEPDFLAGNPTFRSPQLPAEKTYVVVRGALAPTDLTFKISRVLLAAIARAAQPLSPSLRLTPYDNLQKSDIARAWSRGVAKVTIAGTELCTGFLVRPDLLVTDYHCIDKSQRFQATKGAPNPRCDDVTFAFDYVSKSYSPPLPIPRCVKVEKAAAPPIDLALLRLTPSPGADRVIRLAAANGAEKLQVSVMEHPFGYPLMVARQCALGHQLDPIKVEHDCDTLGGASGSPILNAQGEVVAIHTNGYADDNATMADLLLSYTQTCTGVQHGTCGTNQGTEVSELAKLLVGVY